MHDALAGTPSGTFLWAEVCAVWIAALYLFPRGPYGQEESRRLAERGAERRRWRRGRLRTAVVAGLAAGLLPGLGLYAVPARLGLSLLVAAGAFGLPWLRLRVGTTTPRPAWTVWAVDAFAVPAGALAIGAYLRATGPGLLSPARFAGIEGDRLIAIAVLAAVVVYATEGGTHLVRAVLDSVTVKPHRDEGELDVSEYGRGRVIGNLERLLLLFFAILGSYAAAAVVIAAKGLVRWREFGDRDFAEYFLIGSLSSLLVALVLGALTREVLLGM